MRLVYTIPDFWPYVRRGSERLVHDLSVTMAQRGHNVTVVSRSTNAAPDERKDEGFEVRYRPVHRRLNRYMGWTDEEGFAVTAAAAALRRNADIYHAFYLTDGYGLALATRLRRKPFVLSWHGTPDRAFWESVHPRTHRWYLATMRKAARVTVMSEAAARRMREDYDFEPRILVPGIFTAEYEVPRRNAQHQTIVCASAMDDRRKRVDVLIDAFSILARNDSEVRLLLIGPGDPAAALAKVRTIEPTAAARIEVRAARSEELPAIYAGCSVGALASHREAFGLVVAEYLAAGMPAAVSDDGGSVEVISHGTGVAFAYGNVEACAAAMRTCLVMATDTATPDRCRARAREFDWSVRVQGYEKLYAELTN